mmetsp:Transcript_20030/g.60559  ORF Transcript_20030/g.60559 Transcript_20030/m.60559 type:complete len:555 (+) Transcript_20030:346-2010(+)
MAHMELILDDELNLSQAVNNPPSGYLHYRISANGSTQNDSHSLTAGHKVSKEFNDHVHGLIRLDAVCMHVIDTPHYQRLRDLKQLGLSYFVFPSASHNRFEHCLGVAHLAEQMAERIRSAQGRELGITRRDVETVELAGLCHDLGHGPYSHVFDSEFLKRVGVPHGSWSHEAMSVKILKSIKGRLQVEYGDDRAEEFLPDVQVQQVEALIMAGDKPSLRGAHDLNPALYDIVANGLNGIDVDKVDYLMRDSKMCGVRTSCDYDRVMQHIKVIDNEICFKSSLYHSVYELFHDRAMMHSKVYHHRKAKAIEYMLVDALLEADKALCFSDFIHDPERFIKLDDTLLKAIESFGGLGLRYSGAHEDALVRAQAIIARLRKRDLYQFVKEVTIPPEMIERKEWQCGVMPSVADLITCGGSTGVALREEDVFLTERKVDFSKGRTNPLDNVKFFEHYSSDSSFSGSQRLDNSMLPKYFQDVKLRIYCRKSDTRYLEAVEAAFDGWKAKNLQTAAATPASPFRAKQRQRLDLAKKRKADDEAADTGGRRLMTSFIGIGRQ